VERKWALRFFFAANRQQAGQSRGSCILQHKRVLQELQEGSCRGKTGQAEPAKVLQEGSRQQVKEVAWSLGSLQAGRASLSVGGVAVDGRSMLSGMHGGMQLFSGRLRTQLVKDLGDQLEVAYAKAPSKDKNLTRAEFLHQLAECEALRVWCKNLKPREAAAGIEWT
jgi:hypothetical protein